MARFLTSLFYPLGVSLWIGVCNTVYASQTHGQIHLLSTYSRFSSQLCKKFLSPSPEVRGSCNDSGAAAMKGFAEAVCLFKIWKVCQLAMCHTGLMLLILTCESKRLVWMCWLCYVRALLLFWHRVEDRCDTTNQSWFLNSRVDAFSITLSPKKYVFN